MRFARTPVRATGVGRGPENLPGVEPTQSPRLSARRDGRSRRLFGAFIALATAAVSLAPFATSPARAQLPGECGRRTGLWRSVEGPRFTEGGSVISDHAVDPFHPFALYATNGRQIFVSGDGGCEWNLSFEGGAGSGVTPAVPYSIVRLVSPRPAAALALIEQAGGTRLIRTVDDGETWEAAGAGLPPVGRPEVIAHPTRLGQFVYVGIDGGDGALDLLYASTDGGATFTLRSDLQRTIPQAGIQGIEVDPIDPSVLWAFGTGGLYRSRDGGASFRSVDEFTGDTITEVDSFHRSGAPARLLVFRGGGGRAAVGVSNDGGNTWGNIFDAPRAVDSAAHGSTAADAMVTAGGRAFLSDVANVRFVDAGAPTRGIRGIVSTTTTPVHYIGHTDRTIEHYVRPSAGGGLPGLDIDVSIVERAEQALKRARFGPKERTIRLAQRASKTVPYRLALPPRPVPLDVYFVVDTSSSMIEPLAGLARSLAEIAQALEDRRIDVEFGLAEYRAYPDSAVPRPNCEQAPPQTPGGCESNFLYRQKAEIGTDVGALATAIESLAPAGGGRVDAQLPALFVTATGAAQDVHPIGARNTNGTDVPPGQQADFRAKALKVVVHATDEPLPRRGGPDTDPSSSGNVDSAPWPENMPTVDEVTRAFRERGIYHVSIALGETENVVADLTRLARDTGTVARSRPVDCDGDGRADIGVGDPLVCRIGMDEADEARHMVPAVVNLLESVQDLAPVGLSVVGDDEVVRSVSPERHEGVVLQTANTLGFEVTYRCPAGSGGERHRVEIAPEVNGRVVPGLSAAAVVVCKKTVGPGEEAVLPPVVASAPLIAVPLIPAAPPPPAPVTNAQTATQSQAQAQGATAFQREEEPQLAFAGQDDLEEEELYAMVALERGEVHAGAALGLGTVAVSLMYLSGLALRRRLEMQGIRRR